MQFQPKNEVYTRVCTQHWVYAAVYNSINRKSMTYFTSECTHQTYTWVTYIHTRQRQSTVSLFCPRLKTWTNRKKTLRITWVWYKHTEREKMSVVSLKLNNYDPASIDLCMLVVGQGTLSRTSYTHTHASWRRKRRGKITLLMSPQRWPTYLYFSSKFNLRREKKLIRKMR